MRNKLEYARIFGHELSHYLPEVFFSQTPRAAIAKRLSFIPSILIIPHVLLIDIKASSICHS